MSLHHFLSTVKFSTTLSQVWVQTYVSLSYTYVSKLFPSFVSCFLVDEREDVQKKTFTKWVNSQLAKVREGLAVNYDDLMVSDMYHF